MKLIVGLGNPGAQYTNTRHNAGFMVVDALASEFAVGQIARSRFNSITLDANIGGEKVLLIKPTGFMNRSGQAVGEAIRFFKLNPQEDMIVLVDDIALPVGHIRVRKRGGTGGHNGLSDIDRLLGGEDYPRVRIGVGNVPKFMDQSDWVLSKFMKEEQEDVLRSIKAAADATECMLDEGITKAMNAFNTKLVKPKPDPKTESPKQSDSASDTNTQNQETKNASAQQGPNKKMENENVN